MEESESSRRKRPLDETFSKMPPSAAPAPSADVSWVSQPQVSEHEKWLAARVHSNSSSSKEISLEKLGFCWDQTDDEVRVYFSLPGTSSDNVSAKFSHRTCALTAEVGGSRCARHTRFYSRHTLPLTTVPPSSSLAATFSKSSEPMHPSIRSSREHGYPRARRTSRCGCGSKRRASNGRACAASTMRSIATSVPSRRTAVRR